MKKTYAAVYLFNPEGYPTKHGFTSLKDARSYLKKFFSKTKGKYRISCDWIIVSDKILKEIIEDGWLQNE